jgi:hypothetical protein
LAEDILDRIDRGASINEIGDLLDMRVKEEAHPLAQKNPLYLFLTMGGAGDFETIVYFPDEDAFYLNTPNYLYGDEDGELVSQYIEDIFGDGVMLEREVGFSLVCRNRNLEQTIDEMVGDLDQSAFNLEFGEMDVQRMSIADREDLGDDVVLHGGCLARVEIDGDEAVDALFSFYDGDLYQDARQKNRDLMHEWFADVCEGHVINTLEEQLRSYCRDIKFMDIVGN